MPEIPAAPGAPPARLAFSTLGKRLMHARDLVELAALVASQGPALIEGKGRISATGIEHYWNASRERLDLWARALTPGALCSGSDPSDASATGKVVLEEVLVGEMATRVWTAVLYAYDRRRSTAEVEPIARSIYLGHLEARQRALALIVHSPTVTASDAVTLNRLRRRVERWTDVLLAHLLAQHDVAELAFDPARTREFAADLQDERRHAGGRQAWPLLLASLRVAFQSGLSDASPHSAAHREIAASILGCFPTEMFDATGLFRSLWLVRLSNVTDDAEGLLAELMRSDDARDPRLDKAIVRRGPDTTRWHFR